MTAHPHFTPPQCDGSEDITDVWIEETDPENERGECCEAHFIDTCRGTGCRCALVAVTVIFRVDGRDVQTCLPRDMAIAQLGPVAVTRIEQIRARELEEAA